MRCLGVSSRKARKMLLPSCVPNRLPVRSEMAYTNEADQRFAADAKKAEKK